MLKTSLLLSFLVALVLAAAASLGTTTPLIAGSALPAPTETEVLPSPTPSSAPSARPTGEAGTTPTAPSVAGWKTLTYSGAKATMDYPGDWSVEENATGITLTSPPGAVIRLTPVDTGGLSPEEYLANNNDMPNVRCTRMTNSHGVEIRTCFDTISASLIATFSVRSSSGEAPVFALSASRRTVNVQIWDQMLASIQPAP